MYFCEETGEFIHPIFFDSQDEAREVRASSSSGNSSEADAEVRRFLLLSSLSLSSVLVVVVVTFVICLCCLLLFLTGGDACWLLFLTARTNRRISGKLDECDCVVYWFFS